MESYYLISPYKYFCCDGGTFPQVFETAETMTESKQIVARYKNELNYHNATIWYVNKDDGQIERVNAM